MDYIDLRSDTVTEPTPSMLKVMVEARVGDDVYGDDPTVNQLEQLAALLTGKEASIFVPSGTFGNQLAILTHAQRGDEIIVGQKNHIVQYEVGAPAFIAGVQLRTVRDIHGHLDLDEVASLIRGEGYTLSLYRANMYRECPFRWHGYKFGWNGITLQVVEG